MLVYQRVNHGICGSKIETRSNMKGINIGAIIPYLILFVKISQANLGMMHDECGTERVP